MASINNEQSSKRAAEPPKKRYVAVRGINFEGLKDKPRIEPGQRIPDAATKDDIEALLAVGAITEAK